MDSNIEDYCQVQKIFPVTNNDSSSYDTYSLSETSNNNEITDLNSPSPKNDYITKPNADSLNTHETDKDVKNIEFATVIKLKGIDFPKKAKNQEETAENQTSYQQNEFTDNITEYQTSITPIPTPIDFNINSYNYNVNSAPVEYNTNSLSYDYNYNVNSAPVEYNTNSMEVVNDYNIKSAPVEYNTNSLEVVDDYYNNNHETSADIGVRNDNFYNTELVDNSNFNNFSNYNTNSVPIDITPTPTPQFNEDDDTEIIPVEETEYIPVKRKKFIRAKKAKVVPQKRTVIIPKKIIVPIPVKKRIYIQKQQNPKVMPYLTEASRMPYVIKQQKQIPEFPTKKILIFTSAVPVYKPRTYRIKL